MRIVTRLVVVVVAVATVAVVASSLIVRELAAESTIGEVERLFDDQRRIADTLLESAITKAGWDGIDDVADELADETGLRIVVTDADGRTITDTERDTELGDRTALSADVVQLLDVEAAFFGEVGVALDLDEEKYLDELIDCLAENGALVAVEIDAFGQAVPIASDLAAEQECTADILFELGDDEFVDFAGSEAALLYLGYSGSGALDTIDEGIGASVVLVVIAVAGSAGLIVWWWGTRTLRPVGDVARAARRMGDGDLSVRVGAAGSGELAELAGAFDEMADSLAGEDQRRRRLTSDIAHELRNPLANVTGHLDAVTDGVMQPDDELIGILQDETAHLAALVDDLQTLTQAEAGDLAFATEVIDVAELLGSVRTVHAGRSERAGVAVELLPADRASVLGDPGRLRQVMGNLVDNAIRYSDHGSTVTLSWRTVGAEVALEVRDDGIGLSADDASKVFDRFHRADASRSRSTGGRGLGLSIAQRFVETMGGSIEVDSQLDVGSTFVVRLPAADLTTGGQ